MKNRSSIRSFAAGVLLGVLVGSAGLSAAAFGYKGWSRFSHDFKMGYVAGWRDMANISRNLQPGGFIDQKYPHVGGPKPREWVAVIDDLYADPEKQGYTMTSILQLAAHELQKKRGSAQTAEERTRERMIRLLGQSPDEVRKSEAEAAKRRVKMPEAYTGEPWGKRKKGNKWCRCDGSDGKGCRANAGESPDPARQAAAAAKKEKTEKAAPAAGD